MRSRPATLTAFSALILLLLSFLVGSGCGSAGDGAAPATAAAATATVSADSTAPKTFLPYRLEATEGATTMVVFRVEDEAPQVTVTLRLRGPVDKTFTRTVKTNEDVRWTLPGELKDGRYQVLLSAVDAEGNTTLEPASKTMTVIARSQTNDGGRSGWGNDGSTALGSGAATGTSSGAVGITGGSGGGGGGGTTVYVTNTGSKYHLAGCQYLSDSQMTISLADALAGGYGPCSVCNPPIQ